jgi:hypothetical protein
VDGNILGGGEGLSAAIDYFRKLTLLTKHFYRNDFHRLRIMGLKKAINPAQEVAIRD